ncbi:MAG: hypothetical protein HY516_00125 [Candidatus Aenigmarchaeota archaeon]|nr:hypothetical protein [Candidatus Aenigmarchaeota archaeon]
MAARMVLEDGIDFHRVLEEAHAFMGLEAVARKINPEKPDLGELDEFVLRTSIDLVPYVRSLFFTLGERLKRRVESVHRLDHSDEKIFRLVFGLTPPSKFRLKRGPYSLQFDLEDADYRTLSASMGLGKGYADTQGVCLNPGRIQKRIRDAVGGSVILAKASYVAEFDQETEKQLIRTAYPLMDTEGNFYVRGSNGFNRLNVRWKRCDDPVLDRHEQVHAFQNLVAQAGYPNFNGSLEHSLFEEEQAQHIAEMDNDAKPNRRPLLHTGYYSELNVPEGKFAKVARRYHDLRASPGTSPHRAALVVIRQRSRNETALAHLRGSADPQLSYLVDWALPTINFYTADRVLQKMAALYQAS